MNPPKTELQDPTDPRPDIQLHLLAISSSTDYGHQLFYNLGYKDVVWPWIAPHTGHSSAMVMPTLSRPRSRGSVTLRSPDPAQPPAIQPNYLADPRDRQVLLAAVNLSLALVDTAALRGIGATLWGEDELCGSRGLGLEFGTTAYWDCYISQYTATIYHPVGTCAMGTVLDNRWVYSIFSKDIWRSCVWTGKYCSLNKYGSTRSCTALFVNFSFVLVIFHLWFKGLF